MKYKVLITTSGIGSRLGDLTDFTNKALVRVGDKPAITHIIESYPKDTSFVITLGHYGNHVKEYVGIAHPELDVSYVVVDKFVGPGTSLAYSILQAKQELQCPFVFNACDTILKDNSVLLQSTKKLQNFCFGNHKKNTSQYATLLVEKDKLLKIKDKGELNYDFAYIGLCGIRDYDLFWEELETAYCDDQNNSSLYEGTAINKMLKTKVFAFCETDGWLDIGNVGELEKTRQYFEVSAEVLEKKEESIYFFDDHVIKFFSNKEINKNRIIRAKQLGDLVPTIVDYGDNFYKYEKSKGKLFSKSVTEESFKRFLDWSMENLWRRQEYFPDAPNTRQNPDFNKTCHDFYIKKSLKRIDAYLDGKRDSDTIINGVRVPAAKKMLEKLDTQWLCNGIPSQFHGDFILDNVLETKSGFCLLDWRQDFGGNLVVGDIYYDLAKLNHNLTINHEIANKKLFDHSPENCYILCNSKLVACKEILKTFITENGFDYKKVELLTAIIWINMAPLHEYPFRKFLYNFGKYNLNKALNYEN